MLSSLLAFIAALMAPRHAYSPCAHGPDEPGPVTTRAEQARIREAIREAVAARGGADIFARYLIAVATRESSLRPGVIHVADAEHYTAAYRRLRRRHIAAGNPFAREPAMWLSYGLFGLNSNYFAGAEDPRRLCELEYSVAVYADTARLKLARMRRACRITAPTWGDVHRAIQGGRLCPDGGHEAIPARLAAEPVRPGDLGAR